jgi:hypothetical protein
MSRKIGPLGLIAICFGYVLNDIVDAALGPTDYEVVRDLVRDAEFRSAVTEISENVVRSTVIDNRSFFSENNNFRVAVSDIAVGALEDAFNTFEFEGAVKRSVYGCSAYGQLEANGKSFTAQVQC